MIVEYAGSIYKFIRNDKEDVELLPYQLEKILKGYKDFGSSLGKCHLIGMNICFSKYHVSVSLIDLYTVAHVELKPLIAELIFKEQQYQINDLSSKIQSLTWKSVRF